jgi:hypothetical protein
VNILQRAAAAGGLAFNIGKCTWLKLGAEALQDVARSDGTKEEITLGDTPLKRVYTERYLGSRFESKYDNGNKNISQRVGMARVKLDRELAAINSNRFVPWRVKMDFYRTDILSILLHGVQYWHIDKEVINKLEQFQREALMKILGRTYRDRISNVEFYSWLHKNHMYIYPMEYAIRERKIRHFSNDMRNGIKKFELANKLYWCDIKASATYQDFEYEHIKDLKECLSFFNISGAEANNEYTNKLMWEKRLKHHKQVMFEEWRMRKMQELTDKRRLRLESGEEDRMREAEIEKNKGWYYKPRPLPGGYDLS